MLFKPDQSREGITKDISFLPVGFKKKAFVFVWDR